MKARFVPSNIEINLKTCCVCCYNGFQTEDYRLGILWWNEALTEGRMVVSISIKLFDILVMVG